MWASEALRQAGCSRGLAARVEGVAVGDEAGAADTALLPLLFSFSCPTPSPAAAKIQFEESRGTVEKYDTGLRLAGKYQNNQEGLVDDDTLPYAARSYIGLEWDLLSDGFMEHSKLRKSIAAGLVADRKLLPLKQKEEAYPFSRTALRYLFGRARQEKLKDFSAFLTEYLAIIRPLYLSGNFPLENVRRVEAALDRAEILQGELAAYLSAVPGEVRKWAGVASVDRLPVMKPDIALIRAAVTDPERRKTVLSARRSALLYEYESKRDIEVKPFARFYSGDDRRGYQDYFALGVEASIPVPFGAGRREMRDREELLAEAEYDGETQECLHDVMDGYAEYLVRLDRLAELLARGEVLRGRLVNELVKADLGDPAASLPLMLEILQEFEENRFSVLDAREALFLRLLLIMRYVPGKDVFLFARPVDPAARTGALARVRPGRRALYVTPEEFERVENRFLVWYLRSRSIRTVYIGARRDQAEKIREFTALCGTTAEVISGKPPAEAYVVVHVKDFRNEVEWEDHIARLVRTTGRTDFLLESLTDMLEKGGSGEN